MVRWIPRCWHCPLNWEDAIWFPIPMGPGRQPLHRCCYGDFRSRYCVRSVPCCPLVRDPGVLWLRMPRCPRWEFWTRGKLQMPNQEHPMGDPRDLGTVQPGSENRSRKTCFILIFITSLGGSKNKIFQTPESLYCYSIANFKWLLVPVLWWISCSAWLSDGSISKNKIWCFQQYG